MDTKDKKNSPVVDEYVNVESEAVVNDGGDRRSWGKSNIRCRKNC